MLLFEIRLSFHPLFNALKKVETEKNLGAASDRFRHVIRPFVRKFDLESDFTGNDYSFLDQETRISWTHSWLLSSNIFFFTKKVHFVLFTEHSGLGKTGLGRVRRHINRLIRESKDIGLEFSGDYKFTPIGTISVYFKLYGGWRIRARLGLIITLDL